MARYDYSNQYYNSNNNRSRGGPYGSRFGNDNDYNMNYGRRSGSSYGRNEYDVGNDDYARDMRYGRSGIESNRDFDYNREYDTGYMGSGAYEGDYDSDYRDNDYDSSYAYGNRLPERNRYYGQGSYESRNLSGSDRGYGTGYGRNYEGYNESNYPRGSYYGSYSGSNYGSDSNYGARPFRRRSSGNY